MEVRKCKQCGEEFKFRACPTDIDSNRGKYCSEECRRLSRRTLPREIVCERCGKVKLRTKGRVNRFCSHKCYALSLIGRSPGNKGKHMSEKQRIGMMGGNAWNWNGGKPKCKVCKTVLKYGSEYCLVHWKRENHPNWRGGVTRLQELIRKSYKYVQWRRKVLVRDSRACLECGVDWNGEWGLRSNLNVDHIKPFSELLFSNNIKSLKDAYSCSELWDMANARTLCGDCHRRTENYGFNQYFKLKQIINNR